MALTEPTTDILQPWLDVSQQPARGAVLAGKGANLHVGHKLYVDVLPGARQ